MHAVRIYDEALPGARTEAVTLTLVSERVTARELIRRRVEAELESVEPSRRSGVWSNGLGQVTPEELALNGAAPLRVATAAAVTAACEAFVRHRFLLLVGDRQVESLDELVVIDGRAEVTFLRLVPIVGG